MRWPVGKDKKDFNDNWYNAQAYGAKTTYGYHEGDDFNLKTGGDTDLGQPLYAITNGTVTSVHTHTTKPTYGNHIHIQHDGPWGTVYSHYAHCQSVSVLVGDSVREGQEVGRLGKSGTDAAHLHFAIKNQPTGIDGIAKTLDDLKKWENPTEFIKKWSNTMPDDGTINIPQKTFEELVGKATKYDAFVNSGWNTPEFVKQTIEDYKKQLSDVRGERDTALKTVEDRRKEWNELIAFLATELGTRQDVQEIRDVAENYDRVIGDYEDTRTKYAADKKSWAETELELNAEIARLQALLKQSNVLENSKMEDLLREIVRRLISIVKK